MNHLAHFVLAGDNTQLRIGGFLGDYVKGRLVGNFDTGIERGIKLHRAIDAYTDHHRIVKQSQQRLSPEFRRYSGIIMDIVYDHLLAKTWCDYYPWTLEEFSTRTLKELVENSELLPEAAASTARKMQQHNSQASYGKEAFVRNSLDYLSTRLTRSNPLKRAYSEALPHLEDLGVDFSNFYPEVMDFCDEWMKHH